MTSVLTIRIVENEDNDTYPTVPYTLSPLDTCRGGKGFQMQRKQIDTIGNGSKDKKSRKDKKDKKDKKDSEKHHARY